MIRQCGARPRSFLSLAGLLSLHLCTAVPPAFAASFVVTKTADTNDGTCNAGCSLREAITAANAAATDDTITFAAGANGGIELSSALPALANNGTLTITGNGQASTWLATPGDFDGDGKVDAGAYRKSTGGWRYRSSVTGLKTILPMLGGPGFVPVVRLRP